MERVAFLVEDTAEYISCLLNPESVVMTRSAGVETRRSSGGRLTGIGMADDPMLFTGGGRTELRLELLFDTDLGPTADAGDVRRMTRPIWQLAENSTEVGRSRRPPRVRFVWGRAWNLPGVVTEVAERFDRFGADGLPLRSWMRLVFVRIGEEVDDDAGGVSDTPARLPRVDLTGPAVGALPVLGDGSGGGVPGNISDPGSDTPLRTNPAVTNPVELGLLSQRAFGTPLLWKQLLAYNRVDDPLRVRGPLAVPPTGGRA